MGDDDRFDRELSPEDPTLSESGVPRRPASRSDSSPSSRRAPRGPLPEIAGYRLIQRLGEGGMGEVYEAEQLAPVRRRVALKLLKHGLTTREAQARFEAERQALALMTHSSIAKVFDAGTTASGRPFFAMEHLQGVGMMDYCDANALGVRQRLELFIQVCQAVQHAHQKGIIHRDLKPSNVLVTIEDGHPVPKVIDFGVAKATALPLTDQTMHTTLGQLIGTPEYMSPEQANLSGLDIDTRTDVYALGVMLYLLLTGVLPFDKEKFRSGGFEGMRRIIREEEPPRPSARLAALGEEAEALARRRGTEASSLVRLLAGDLDWIVLKALEKDRIRRYETVHGLVLDLERYLGDEPVSAARPSTAYRLRKFARRHRLAVTVGGTAAVLLLAFAITMAWLALVIAGERDRANREAKTAQEVSDFLVELFEVADPTEVATEMLTVREVLDAGADRARQSLTGQPLVQARLMNTMGGAYRNLGLVDDAEELLESALQTRQKLLGEDSLAVAETLVVLAELRGNQGDFAEQERLARRSLAIREKALGPEHPAVAESLRSIAWARLNQDDHAGAEPLFERALAIRRAALEPRDPDVAESLFDLGSLYFSQGRYRLAERLLERSLEINEEVLGPRHYLVRDGLNNLGLLHMVQGSYAEAERLLNRALEVTERVLGPDSRAVASSLSNLAVLVDTSGRPEEAEAMAERALAIYEESLEPDHYRVGMALANLAWMRYRQGKYASAHPLYERALGVYESSLGVEHTNVATLLHDYALLLLASGELDRSATLVERALAIRREAFGVAHPKVAECLLVRARVAWRQGKHEAARQDFAETLAIREARLGPDHPAVAETIRPYAALLEEMGRPEEAAALWERLPDGGDAPSSAR